MNKQKIKIFLALVLSVQVCGYLKHVNLTLLRPSVEAVNQTIAAQRIVNTILAYNIAINSKSLRNRYDFPWERPEESDYYLQVVSRNHTTVHVNVNFSLLINGKDSFHVKSSKDILYINASSGASAIWGFHYFLKYYCQSHIGWQVENIKWPKQLPTVDEIVIANDIIRYYQNICTYSYSFVWWKEREWAKHIVWMALNGINLSLAPMGHEIIWQQVYLELGLNKDEIDEHFTGPAYTPWYRMGNLHSWVGPLSEDWHIKTKELQLFLIRHMTSLGMIPVLPAFAGHIPRALLRIYPDLRFETLTAWAHVDKDFTSPIILDPSDPLYGKLGDMFLKKITEVYGCHHVYNAEPFDEISKAMDTQLVRKTALAIFNTMFRIDYKAIWLLQNWMFISRPGFWPRKRIKSLLTSLPLGRLLILDMQSEQFPFYEITDMYFGQPFIWCMLHNFGGTLGMLGRVQVLNNAIHASRKLVNSTMVGIGLTPEGINQNYVVYDLMLEYAWRKGPVNLQFWSAKYAERRYGCGNKLNKAWWYLIRSVYQHEGRSRFYGEYAILSKPGFKFQTWAWYDRKDLMNAWREFVLADCFSNAFLHDLTDVTRQALQYTAEQLYTSMSKNLSDVLWFKHSKNQFLEVLTDLQLMLKTHEDFSIRSWLGQNFDGETINILNALYQITFWAPSSEITDYARKQWAETFEFYFIPRWKQFLDAYEVSLAAKKTFNENSVRRTISTNIQKQFMTHNFSVNSTRCSYTPYQIKKTAKEAFLKWYILPNVKDLSRSEPLYG